MPSIDELHKLRARVEKERAKAAGHNAAALEKSLEAKRQAEADELNAELARLERASSARGKEATAVDALAPEDEAARLIKAAQKAMSGTPVDEIKAPKTGPKSSTPTPTNEEK